MALALIALAIYAIQVTGENNANEDALESVKDEKEAEIKRLSLEVDSIAKLAETYRKDAENDFEQGQDLEEEKENLENTDYENEPYHINSADSLRELISRRFYNRKP